MKGISDFSTRELIVAVFVGILLTLAMVLTVGGLAGQFELQHVSTAVSGAAAIGTLVLAGATLLSVRQSRTELDELRKDRQRPLAIDEISNVVQPSMDILESNVKNMDSKHDDRWHYHPGRLEHRFVEDPRPVLACRQFDPVSITRFKEGDPELYDRLDAHDWFLEYLSNLADQIKDQIEDEVESIFKNSSHTEGLDFESEKLVVYSYMMMQLEDFENEDARLYEFWEQDGAKLNRILLEEAGDIHSELRDGEELLAEYSEDVYEDLTERRLKLQGEFGISKSEFESDIEIVQNV